MHPSSPTLSSAPPDMQSQKPATAPVPRYGASRPRIRSEPFSIRTADQSTILSHDGRVFIRDPPVAAAVMSAANRGCTAVHVYPQFAYSSADRWMLDTGVFLN